MADETAARPQPAWRFWGFVLFMLALMGLFVTLGLWQVERMDEKERLIANVTARFNQPPVPLPPASEWVAFDAEAYDYRPVTFTGTYLPEKTVLVFTSLGEPKGDVFRSRLLGDDPGGGDRRRHRVRQPGLRAPGVGRGLCQGWHDRAGGGHPHRHFAPVRARRQLHAAARYRRPHGLDPQCRPPCLARRRI